MNIWTEYLSLKIESLSRMVKYIAITSNLYMFDRYNNEFYWMLNAQHDIRQANMKSEEIKPKRLWAQVLNYYNLIYLRNINTYICIFFSILSYYNTSSLIFIFFLHIYLVWVDVVVVVFVMTEIKWIFSFFFCSTRK